MHLTSPLEVPDVLDHSKSPHTSSCKEKRKILYNSNWNLRASLSGLPLRAASALNPEQVSQALSNSRKSPGLIALVPPLHYTPIDLFFPMPNIQIQFLTSLLFSCHVIQWEPGSIFCCWVSPCLHPAFSPGWASPEYSAFLHRAPAPAHPGSLMASSELPPVQSLLSSTGWDPKIDEIMRCSYT